jgi:hypothetical protein
MPTESIEALEARHGEKMIEIKVRFWTDSIAPEPGQIIPKHALTAGVIRFERNRAHGISSGNPKPFNSLLELGAVMEKLLIENGVTLHPSRKMKRYFAR